MTGFNHGVSGALIALTVKNPALAVPLSFVSHFAQDIIPHWDYSITREVSKQGKFFTRKFNSLLVIDFLSSIVLMINLAFIFPTQKWLIWACMVVAASPDLMWAYYRLYAEKIKSKKPHYDPLARLHIFIQWSQTAKGGLVEIAWAILGLIIIFSLR